MGRKMKQMIGALLIGCFVLTSCGTKENSGSKVVLEKKEVLPVAIQIGEDSFVLQEGDILEQNADLGENFASDHTNEIYLNGKLLEDHEGKVSINGIGIGTKVSDVLGELRAQHALVDSEYDPYQDGCTEICRKYLSEDVKEFYLPDMLDCFISFRYTKASDGQWKLVEEFEDDIIAHIQREEVLKVEYSVDVPEKGNIALDGVISSVYVQYNEKE